MFLKSFNLLPLFLFAAVPFGLSQPPAFAETHPGVRLESTTRDAEGFCTHLQLAEVFEPRDDNEGQPGDTVG
jgi:hypothetical protein